MSSEPPLLSFETLHASPVVSVRAYECRACRGGPQAEEHSERDTIVLMRRGAFRRHFGSRSVTADVNQVVFFARGSAYRVSHPADCGDRGTILSTTPRILAEIVREIDPAAADDPRGPLRHATGPCDTALHARHRELVARLEAARAPEPESEPLWTEVTALQLLADALQAAFARHGSALTPRSAAPPRRASTRDDHWETADAARTWLAARLAERVTLAGVAAAVHASPFHLARLFQRQHGVPLHRYLLGLRLRAALERLLGGEHSISDLARDVGFSSHAHFTDAFRREFGCTPSDVRARGPKALRETSKDPEAG